MYSGDGEYVHFSNKVVLEGSVEHWLGKVEGEMRVTLRTQMGLCKVAHKKTKRDLWIKTWAGQLIIAISQLTWTGDTISAINGGRCVPAQPLHALPSTSYFRRHPPPANIPPLPTTSLCRPPARSSLTYRF
jgi:hypothetical protein